MSVRKMDFASLGLFDKSDLESIHTATLEILRSVGMKIMVAELLEALRKKGALVDENKQIVRFPFKLIEDTIELIRKEIENGKRQNIFNGVVSSKSGGRIQAKFGGACIEYFDCEKWQTREPTQADLIKLVQLGEAISDVTCVGNPVLYLREEDGREVDPRLQRIKTAALVANNTSKVGPTEVLNVEELEFLIEIGTVIRGDEQRYKERPCFITAKETTSPLTLVDSAGKVLVALAKRGLPCTIIPMPISGVTSPVTLAGNMVIANAEVLGVMAAIKAVIPDASVGGGVISGIMDMATMKVSFAAPEAILQDVGIAELQDKLYGFDFGIGTGYIDAKCPGIQAGIEKEAKILASTFAGRVNYPVGILDGGKTFSPEEALIELEIANFVHQWLREMELSEETVAVEVIQRVGIGGNFLIDEHTLNNYKKMLWFPSILDRTSTRKENILKRASEKYRQIFRERVPYELGKEKAKEIDKIVESATRHLL